MASTVSEDEDSVDDFSEISQFSIAWDDSLCEKLDSGDEKLFQLSKTTNVVNKILNRQVCFVHLTLKILSMRYLNFCL